MVAFAALLMLGWRQGVTHEWLAPLTEWNAHLTAALLDLQGIEVMRRGATLRHSSGFSWHIDLACTGLPILALGVAAIALYPTTGRLRVRALALGLPLLFGVNLVRMVHLVRIGIEAPGEPCGIAPGRRSSFLSAGQKQSFWVPVETQSE